MNVTEREPVVVGSSLIVVVNAAFVVAGTFGLHLTGDQVAAIDALLIALMSWWARSRTVASAKHERFLDVALSLPQDSTVEDVESKLAKQ